MKNVGNQTGRKYSMATFNFTFIITEYSKSNEFNLLDRKNKNEFCISRRNFVIHFTREMFRHMNTEAWFETKLFNLYIEE